MLFRASNWWCWVKKNLSVRCCCIFRRHFSIFTVPRKKVVNTVSRHLVLSTVLRTQFLGTVNMLITAICQLLSWNVDFVHQEFQWILNFPLYPDTSGDWFDGAWLDWDLMNIQCIWEIWILYLEIISKYSKLYL